MVDGPRASGWQPLGSVNMPFDEAKARLENFGRAVDAANIPYGRTSNSNSFAAQAPTSVGLPRAIPTEKYDDPIGLGYNS
jgi:hypothetical protein